MENYLGQSLKGNAKPGMSTAFENVCLVIEEVFVEHLECRMFCVPYVIHIQPVFHVGSKLVSGK